MKRINNHSREREMYVKKSCREGAGSSEGSGSNEGAGRVTSRGRFASNTRAHVCGGPTNRNRPLSSASECLCILIWVEDMICHPWKISFASFPITRSCILSSKGY